MLRVIGCITEDHEWRLVVVSALICLVSSFTALSLLSRAWSSEGRTRLTWLAATGMVAGGGVWATHFVAMLAFRPSLPLGFDPTLTILSVVIAIVVMGAGFAVSLGGHAGRPVMAAVGGALVGVGVFVMHYTGMAAMLVAADTNYDIAYVAASLVVGVGLSALALGIAFSGNTLAHRLGAATALTVAIAGLHFIGMAALELTPNPFIAVPAQVIPPEWLALGVALTTLVMLCSGLAGSIVDQRFADRSLLEAQRLRTIVAELVETKSRLEASSARLARALEAADAGSQAKTIFLASMSHELRTPLNAVIGFSEALAADLCGPLNPKQREYVVEIGGAGTQLLTLINDVLDLTKVDTGSMLLEDQEVEIGHLMSDTLAALAARAKQARVALHCEVADDLPLVRADPRRLHQAVYNLLLNGIKFTLPGGSVSLETSWHDGGIAIRISDTGIGMPPKAVAKALESFGQLDGRLDRRYEGTGLGLSIAKRLIEIHGGTLAIDSAPGRGTAVTLTLPADRIIEAALAA